MEEKHPFDVGKPYLGLEYPIARSLKEGADYFPDWRAKVTENYIRQIIQAKDHEPELAKVLEQERDGFIREFVQYHRGIAFRYRLSVERSIRCNRDAATARAIKAMVIAGQSSTKIAKTVSQTTEAIEYFEKLFFDVRRYLDEKLWIRNLCYGKDGHRLLQIAFKSGMPGLSPFLFGNGPNNERNLDAEARIFHGRFQDSVSLLEENNVPVSEEDLDRLERVAQLKVSGALSRLDDPAAAEIKEPNVSRSIRDLTPAGRDRVAAFLNMVLQKAAEKSGAFDADKEKDIAPNCPKKENGQTVEEQANGAE